MAIEVHQEYLKRRYIVSWCSLACFINFLIVAGAAILPLYIAWASHSGLNIVQAAVQLSGAIAALEPYLVCTDLDPAALPDFWIKEQLRYEQPKVTYKSQFVIALNGFKGASNAVPFQLIWSTSPNTNDFLGNVVRTPVLKSSTTDANRDGKPDELRISATMPLASDEVITGATAIAFLDVQLSTVTKLKMDALAVMHYDSGVPGSSFTGDGDLRFQQRAPLPYVVGGIYTPYLLAPLSNFSTATTLDQVQPNCILSAYRSRNFTTMLDIPYPQWGADFTYRPMAPGSVQELALQPRGFVAAMTVRIPPTPVLVRPSVSEELKHGYMQYVAFLVLTATLAWILRKVIFGYHILEASIYVDAPRSKLHIE